VRVAGKGTVEAFNSIAALQYGLAVIVGYSKEDPEKLQILSVRTSQPAGIGGDAGIPFAPASRYRWMDLAGGEDPVYIELRQFMPKRPGMGGGMLLQIYRGIVWTGSAFAEIATQTVSLADYRPTTAGKAALVLVTIDDSASVVCTEGDEADIEDIPTVVIPTPPAGTVEVLAAVRVYYGQTEILEARTNTDIVDLRYSWNSSIGLSHSPLSVLDTPTIDLTISGQQLSASIKDTAVTPGSFTNTNITVDAQGRLTAASTGTMAFSGEVLMQDGVTSPPVPLETEDGTDWLYEG
jgi:hypothetical protein